MAKIRIHELSKELDVPTKELLSFCEANHIEATSHMSALEDDQATMARNHFKKKDTVKPAAESAPVKAADAAHTEEKSAEKERPKKKASISAVYNPQNGKTTDRRSGERRRETFHRPGERQGRPAGERPMRPAGERPARPAGERPMRPAGERPMRPAGERPARPAGERPMRPAGERPMRPAGERPARPAGERPVQSPAGKPVQTAESAAVHTTGPRFTGERVTIPTNDRPARQEGERQNVYRDRPQRRNDRQEGGDFHARQDKKPYSNGSKNYQSNRNNGSGSEGNRGGRPDYQNRSKDARVGGSGSRQNTASARPAMDDVRGKDSRKQNNAPKKKADYEKKNRKQEQYINLEKKTGHKKRNAVPQAPTEKKEDEVRTIIIPEIMTVKELADAMKIQASEIIKKLFLEGVMMTMNSEIEFEKAEEIALEFNCIAEMEEKVDVIAELLKEEEEEEDTMVTRPPVVCVMGHVDHGKTSLLDAIRNTRVTDREAGGITQAIGASVVQINGQKITFLDTPGHEAFTAMRMRGANSTDIAILVVAADDGIMPQTVEAINHAKAAGVEIIVAINKIDKPGANIEKVKQELTEYELVAEDWGGSTICVPVSAKTGEGISDLLEMVLLSAEVLELKANPHRNARGLVIEAQLDKGRGAVATVLVQKGTLKVGEYVACGSSYGRIRAMVSDTGKRLKVAGPSTPVEILGLNSVPNAGEVFVMCDNEKEARSFAETFVEQDKEKKLAETRARMSLDDLFSQIQAGNLKELNLIVKADVQGSVEAVKQSLTKLSNEEVVVKVIHGGVGAINESDVVLASASNAIIIGFNVKPDPVAKSISESENVDIRLYNIIYKAIEDIEAAMKGMLDPIFEEQVIGHAEVRQIFKASGVGNIAGSYVLDGIFERGCKIRITREGNQIYEGALASLKRFKDDVKEVKAGFECGLVFENFNDLAELDVVEAYKMVEVPR